MNKENERELKKVDGELSIECYVNCPNCDNYIDLFEITDLTDEGDLGRKLLDGQRLGCENLNEVVECAECRVKFRVGGVNW